MQNYFTKTISTDRVLTKLDEYFSVNDYSGAERHLLYWLNEALALGDERGRFSMLNELVGLYRKAQRKEKALKCVEEILNLSRQMQITATLSYGTALLNCATCFKAFSEPQKSLELFKQAEEIYEKELAKGDVRKGGLYNNYALTLVDLKAYEQAEKNYDKALEITGKAKSEELDYAITLLNKADLKTIVNGEKAEKDVSALIEESYSILINHAEKNGYYAFVCEKCASAFGYHGYFLYESELKKIANEIYSKR